MYVYLTIKIYFTQKIERKKGKAQYFSDNIILLHVLEGGKRT